MYNIGDKVVYPMHGAGVIEGIESKEILGQEREYYILHVPGDNMKIMIPVDTADSIGVRKVIDRKEIKKVFDTLSDESTDMPSNWNRRNRGNTDKLKTGDIFEVAEVVRNLMRLEAEKHLSAGEKKLMTNARHILLTEMVLAAEAESEPEKIAEMIDEAVGL
ncbi:MAG: CarD family transcriptional regulator [Anaerovoracaceae bacterium]|nr:CarD family transcriptional regulator [Anaerovoracaceae bacterium]